MDKENLYSFPHDFPYSTEFESENEDFPVLTRRFTRTTSLHATFKEKRVLWGSPESTLVGSPFAKNEDEINAWNLLQYYTAAAGEVARLKMKNNIRVVHGAPQTHYRSDYDGTEFLRRQQFCRNRGGSACWPPPHCQYSYTPVLVMKPLVPGGATAVKKECAGTGVFLPRRYCDKPAEIQAHIIKDSFIPFYGRRNTMIVAAHQQRRQSNIHRGVMESPVNHPEMLLPQEWTY